MAISLLVLLINTFTALAQEEQIPLGEVVEEVKCLEEPDKRYALYLPSYYRPDRKWPVLLLFEPSARAPLPVRQFAEAAETFGFILACTYDTRNYVTFDITWKGAVAMWNDLITRFPLDARRMYAGGFSGGARLASRIAMVTEKIEGLVLCGAGFWERTGKVDLPPFVVVSTIGNLDMNYTELVDLEEELIGINKPHRRLVFEGGHRWPPGDVCYQALGWLQLQAYQRGLAPLEAVRVEEQIERRKQAAETLENAKKPVEAYRAYRHLVDDFSKVADMGEIEKRANQIESSALYKEREKNLKKAERQEEKYRRQFLKKMFAGESIQENFQHRVKREMIWWRKEIEKLNKRKDNRADPYDSLMAQRVFNSLSALCYEKSVYAFQEINFNRAIFLNKVAELLTPNRIYPYVNLAKAYTQINDKDNAFKALEKCVTKPFINLDRLRAEPLLAPLKDDSRFEEILAGKQK